MKYVKIMFRLFSVFHAWCGAGDKEGLLTRECVEELDVEITGGSDDEWGLLR